ncbi:MAG: hypothetical protein NVSMB52_02730 [Chloroflexota bacterium]
MTPVPPVDAEALWAHHSTEWRNPAQLFSGWQDAATIDPDLLRFRTVGKWWEILAQAGITLFITREYEHLVVALSPSATGGSVSYMRVPHPSGMVIDRTHGVMHLASTRNPNQVFELQPISASIPRLDAPHVQAEGRPMLPVASRFYPGCLYMHDLALIGGILHANAVGQNAVVRLDGPACAEPVWWPRIIDGSESPLFGRNHLQLNSIAAGADLSQSYFSASTETVSARRPGHKNFAVDRRGVIFSGATREPMARGLTRPHSARLLNGRVWVDNSGYGELGVAENGSFTPVARLPGWTRGLCFHDHVAFVGTSRVIPRFRQYAPGRDVDASVCGVHAVDTRSGKILGSYIWPTGNQIFAVDWMPANATIGFPFTLKPSAGRIKTMFYTFQTSSCP